jgi:hypothetical protein
MEQVLRRTAEKLKLTCWRQSGFAVRLEVPDGELVVAVTHSVLNRQLQDVETLAQQRCPLKVGIFYGWSIRREGHASSAPGVLDFTSARLPRKQRGDVARSPKEKSCSC